MTSPWKTVPVEPTPEMLAAGTREWCLRNRGEPYDDEIPAIWRAMLAAAPQQGPMCSRCGSTTVIGCNHMGCFAMEAGEEFHATHDVDYEAKRITEKGGSPMK